MSASEDDVAILTSASTGDEKTPEVPEFPGHRVGDVHQPPHASFQDDRGGEAIGVYATTVRDHLARAGVRLAKQPSERLDR